MRRMLLFLVWMVWFSSSVSFAAKPAIVLTAEGSLVHDVANAVSPHSIDINGKSLFITDVMYCGVANAKGQMIFLLGLSAASPQQEVLEKTDCAKSSVDILHQHANGASVIGAAHAYISSQSYTAIVQISDASMAPGTPFSGTEDAVTKFQKSFSTDNIPLDADFIHETLSGLLNFEENRITIGLFAAKPPDAGWYDLNISPPVAGRFKNLSVFIAHSYIEDIFGRYASNIVFTNQSNPNAALSTFHYAGGPGEVSISANLHSGDVNDDANVAVSLTGDDLEVSDVTVSPRVEACNGSIFQQAACKARNAGHAAFAASIKGFLDGSIKGKFVRPANVTKPMKVHAFGSDILFRAAINQTRATADFLILNGGALLETTQ